MIRYPVVPVAVYLVVFVAVSFAFSIPTPRIRTIGKYSSGPRFGMFKKFQEFFNPPPPEPYIAPYTLDEGEWRSKLSGEEFYVLRQAGTERPWTSPLNDEKREGDFVCKGCGKPLFPHDAKFNSGTGWPSFFKPIDERSVVERVDKAMGMSRLRFCVRIVVVIWGMCSTMTKAHTTEILHKWSIIKIHSERRWE